MTAPPPGHQHEANEYTCKWSSATTITNTEKRWTSATSRESNYNTRKKKKHINNNNAKKNEKNKRRRTQSEEDGS